MTRKDLIWQLQEVMGFEHAKIELEQYMTPPDIAVDFVQLTDCTDKRVVDLGCGTGMLTAAAILMDAAHVYAVDMDSEALEIFQKNIDLDDCTVIHSPIHEVSGIEADICIMNPPFGTRQKGIDKVFIKKSLELAPIAFSLHKSSTREHLRKYCKELGCTGTVLCQVRYNVEKSYKFHKDPTRDIEVDVWKFTR